MAYSFGTVTAEMAYKGHRIETTESPMQIVYVVDGDREHAYWSIADAKRAINGKELKYFSVDVRHWFHDEKKPIGGPQMPERDSDFWDEQKEFFKRYE